MDAGFQPLSVRIQVSSPYVDTAGEVVLAGPFAVARPYRLGVMKVVVGEEVMYLRRDGSRAMEPPT